MVVGEDYKKKYEDLLALVNRPHIKDFLESANIEAAHQRGRWGAEHDKTKDPSMWLWTIAHLCTKALMSYMSGDTNKAKHHTITAAALLAHWHEWIVDHAEGKETRIKKSGVQSPT